MKRTLSFLAGLMLAAAAVLMSVAGPGLKPALFERAVLDTVNREAVGMSESDLTAFARETMDYLRGKKDEWQPVTPFAIPQSFAAHMAEVRGWVDVLRIALPSGLVLAVGCLFLGRDGRAARAGILTLIALIAAALVWAAVDFHSLWMVIHKVFIPGGIFSAYEPVMQLFPLELFSGYLGAVTARLIVYLCAASAFTFIRFPKP